jgi:tetrahydromethanopterin S-methyltransferase subunit E
MNLLQRILGKSVTRLTRLACWLALAGLATMSYSIISPRPLPVIFAMSVGQGIGILAFLCYLLAVVLDVGRHPPRSSLPPGPVASSEADDALVSNAPTRQ